MAAKNPFTIPGWTRDPLPGDEASDSLVIRHPERQVVVLHSSVAGTSLLQRLGLQLPSAVKPASGSPTSECAKASAAYSADADAWSAVIDDYNQIVKEHDEKLPMLKTDENVGGLKTWNERLQVWTTKDTGTCICGIQMKDVRLASFRGVLCFLHFLANKHKQNATAAAAPSTAVAQRAEQIVLADWHADPPANVLKRLLLVGSKSGDNYEKCYKKCHEAFDKLHLPWWPAQWANQQGPDGAAVGAAAAAAAAAAGSSAAAAKSNIPPLPLCKTEAQLKSEQALIDTLSGTVFGQPLAIRHAVNAVWHRLTGTANPDMPTVIVFAGPSGHGKTHLGAELVKALFDSKLTSEQLNRVYLYFSMASLTDKSSISTLLGAAQGLNQCEAPGALITFLKHQKESLTPAHIDTDLHWVVFLDEVDRAYTTLLEDLRNWFDQGQIRSGFGELVEARKGLIIIGTNVGAGVTIRQKDGYGERLSTENCLSRPMPPSAEALAEVRAKVQKALLADLCHGQAPTFGRLPYLAMFFHFSDEEFEKALTDFIHVKIAHRLKAVKGVHVPSNFQICFDSTVVAWVFPFYHHKTGFRGLEYQITSLLGECRKVLLSKILQSQCEAHPDQPLRVWACMENHRVYFRNEGTGRRYSDGGEARELTKFKNKPHPQQPQRKAKLLPDAPCLAVKGDPMSFSLSSTSAAPAAAAAATAEVAAATFHTVAADVLGTSIAADGAAGTPIAASKAALGGVATTAAAWSPDQAAASSALSAECTHASAPGFSAVSPAAAAAAAAVSRAHPLQSTKAICAAMNELGAVHLGAQKSAFQRAVTISLLEKYPNLHREDEPTEINEATWKKALGLSQYGFVHKTGGGVQRYLGYKQTATPDETAVASSSSSKKRKKVATAVPSQQHAKQPKLKHPQPQKEMLQTERESKLDEDEDPGQEEGEEGAVELPNMDASAASAMHDTEAGTRYSGGQ
jgi:hypothetical protein